jgi:hypothetical protein
VAFASGSPATTSLAPGLRSEPSATVARPTRNRSVLRDPVLRHPTATLSNPRRGRLPGCRSVAYRATRGPRAVARMLVRKDQGWTPEIPPGC